MHHTVVRSSPNQIVPNRSKGYSPANNEAGFTEATDLGGAMGAGGIHSTLDDLAKWIQNLGDPRVGNEGIIKEMMTPFELKDGSSTEYGLGLFVQEYKGLKYAHHGGADMAHRSMLIYFPEINAAVVTQSNHAAFPGNNAQKVSDLFFADFMEEEEDDAEQRIAEEQKEFEYDPENFEPLTGRYELAIAPGFVLTFSRDDDRIYTQATGQSEVDLTATSDSTFSLVGVTAAVTFHRNEDGTADSLTLHQNGNHLAKKIEFELEFEEMEKYTGRYFSEEIETLYHIALEDSTLHLRNYQMENDIELTPSDKDKFGGGFPISTIEFVRNEEGEITGFKASSGRTRGVLFEKQAR
ncbi:MAG: serine hydrolase [Balneolaceae bacterium]|nr:MAG: serine hydrolase [Balneolaceae bacterium]